MKAWWWRGAAIAIAVAGAVDPAIPATRRAKPDVAIVAADPPDSLLADRIAGTLRRDYTIVRAPFGAAAATVLVGDHLPAAAHELASPVFAVLPERRAGVTLVGVRAPARVPFDARVPIDVHAVIRGARGKTLQVALQAGGTTVDRSTREIVNDSAFVRVPLTFVPTATGSQSLRVTAQVGAGEPAVADLHLGVHQDRWEVLFFDPRPSWLSTFVRRTLERDARFVVASRVVTSRSISSDAGRPPATLDDPAALNRYAVIVVGAPGALNERAVAGLDAFLRHRAGTVVLLFDQPAGGPLQHLTRVALWSRSSQRVAAQIVALDTDTAALKAADMIWPAQLPALAKALAQDSMQRPVIWRAPVGSGQLIVSGALDAWRYRDPAASSFARFWQTLLADGAEAAPPAIDLRVGTSHLHTGEQTELTVWLRDVALNTGPGQPSRASVSAVIEAPDSRTPLRLWPQGPAGHLRALLRAPAQPGHYRVVVTANGQRAELPIVVAPQIARPEPPEHDLLRAWAVAHNGRAFNAGELAELEPALQRAIRPPARAQIVHPMRSPWWILPFALALAAEWWWRRRRGLR